MTPMEVFGMLEAYNWTQAGCPFEAEAVTNESAEALKARIREQYADVMNRG